MVVAKPVERRISVSAGWTRVEISKWEIVDESPSLITLTDLDIKTSFEPLLNEFLAISRVVEWRHHVLNSF